MKKKAIKSCQSMVSEVKSKSSTGEYSDADSGLSVPYNFFLPEDYDESKTYPMVLGLYIGFSGILEYSVRDFRDLLCALFSMDFLTFYLNSIFSQPVYVNEKPVGLVYRANFFSSYVNPLGIVLTEKWQWILYLLIRKILVLVLTYLLIFIQSFYVKHKYLPRKDIPGGKEK